MPHVFTYPDLPILARKEDILKALKENQTLVVQGGTGSGKTTQLPKFLLEAGLGEALSDSAPALPGAAPGSAPPAAKPTAVSSVSPWPTSGLIGVTQPRRIAAL